MTRELSSHIATRRPAPTRRRHWLPVAVWIGIAVSLSGAVWWLLSGPPPVTGPGSIRFNSPGEGTRLELLLTEYEAGERTIAIRNADPDSVAVDVSLNLPGSHPTTSWLGPDADLGPGGMPLLGIAEPSENVCTWWSETSATCTFELGGYEGRIFSWSAGSAASWTAHRGARWAVLTPYVHPSNVSLGADRSYSNAPEIEVRVLLPLPAASQVIAGPESTWDRNQGAHVFRYADSGQVAAPLVYDQAARPVEEFGLFLLAVILAMSAERVVASLRSAMVTTVPDAPEPAARRKVRRPRLR